MSTIEQTIVDAVVAQLKTIIAAATVTVSGRVHTYATTVLDVLDGELVDFEPSQMPCINVVTINSDTSPVGGNHHDHLLQLVLILYLADSTPGPVLREFIADVFACVGANETWGVPQVIKTDDPSYTKEFLVAGQFIGSAQVGVSVTYRSLRWQL
jgi:hypothetical protein